MRGLACFIAAVAIFGSAAGLQPISASSYEPPLSVPNVTTVSIDHGPLGNPSVEGYWDHDWAPPGEQSNLAVFVVNNSDQATSFVLVFQIRYANDATQVVLWQAAELDAGESGVVSVLWTPDHPGYFEIDIFAVTGLERPAPLSDATLYQTYSRPEDVGQIDDLLPDLAMSAADENGVQQNQTGILGTFGYLVTADSDILIPKNSTEIDSDSRVKFELSDSETWLLKETFIQYYHVGEDFTLGREFDDYYYPSRFPESFNILASDDEREYFVDLSEGDYVFSVHTTFQYNIAGMPVDEGDGFYYFRVVVD